MTEILKIEDVQKSYRKGFLLRPAPVLKGVTFSVPMGSVTGFLGSNGSGKTTTIKASLGLIQINSGEITFFGGQKISSDIRRKIGFLPENPYFYEYLTGREFLNFYGRLSLTGTRAAMRERVTEMLKKVGLKEAGDKALRTYSKGMLQRIGLAQALIHEPEFVILDEPMTGLDPDGRSHVAQIIRETSRAGATVFFSSHLLHDAESLCDRLVILRAGQTAWEGSTKDLLTELEAGYRLSFERKGVLGRKVVQKVEELQEEIDDLRAENANILEVQLQKASLEEAYLRITSGGPP